jgi:hypothetical protein
MRNVNSFSRVVALVAACLIALVAVSSAGAERKPVLGAAALAGNATFAAQIRADAHDRLVRTHTRLLRRVARARGEKLSLREVRRAHDWTDARLHRANARLRGILRELRSTGGAPAVPVPGVLASIAACESGGNPAAIGGGGAYRGKYQMTYSTWASVGGQGDPAAAPEVEQDRRAAMLLARAGTSPWPSCG